MEQILINLVAGALGGMGAGNRCLTFGTGGAEPSAAWRAPPAARSSG
jgi:hypothetical protein